MSNGGYIFFAGVALIVAALIAFPLIGRGRRIGRQNTGEEEFGDMPLIAQLEAEREAILAAVHDLDFDHQTGKITDADHYTLREDLLRRGVAILKSLDAAQLGAIDALIAENITPAQLKGVSKAAKR